MNRRVIIGPLSFGVGKCLNGRHMGWIAWRNTNRWIFRW